MATPSQNLAMFKNQGRGWDGGGPGRATSQRLLGCFSFVKSITTEFMDAPRKYYAQLELFKIILLEK